jgi:hypothetical protein
VAQSSEHSDRIKLEAKDLVIVQNQSQAMTLKILRSKEEEEEEGKRDEPNLIYLFLKLHVEHLLI